MSPDPTQEGELETPHLTHEAHPEPRSSLAHGNETLHLPPGPGKHKGPWVPVQAGSPTGMPWAVSWSGIGSIARPGWCTWSLMHDAGAWK